MGNLVPDDTIRGTFTAHMESSEVWTFIRTVLPNGVLLLYKEGMKDANITINVRNVFKTLSLSVWILESSFPSFLRKIFIRISDAEACIPLILDTCQAKSEKTTSTRAIFVSRVFEILFSTSLLPQLFRTAPIRDRCRTTDPSRADTVISRADGRTDAASATNPSLLPWKTVILSWTEIQALSTGHVSKNIFPVFDITTRTDILRTAFIYVSVFYPSSWCFDGNMVCPRNNAFLFKMTLSFCIVGGANTDRPTQMDITSSTYTVGRSGILVYTKNVYIFIYETNGRKFLIWRFKASSLTDHILFGT